MTTITAAGQTSYALPTSSLVITAHDQLGNHSPGRNNTQCAITQSAK